MEYSNEVLKIVEGALKSDKVKVSSYTKLLIEKLHKNGEPRLASSFVKLLDSKMSSMTQMTINDSMKVPIDQESRLPMADIVYPREIWESRVVLNPVGEKQLEKFVDYYSNASKLLNEGIKIPNTILLYGPPGCGKSKLAQVLCTKIGLPLVTARLDGMISSYLGSTSKNIRAVFEYAQKVPCILFLDEFDAIAKVRDDHNELGELKRVVNSLLQNIDQLRNGSIIIAATNHEHLLDPAVWRRFGFKINIDKPDMDSRYSLVKLFLGDKIFSNREMEVVTNLFSGLSGSDIEEICQKTKIDAVLKNYDISLNILLENYFDFSKIDQCNDDCLMDKKEFYHRRAIYLRNINSKLFTYELIGKILNISKSYVSSLIK